MLTSNPIAIAIVGERMNWLRMPAPLWSVGGFNLKVLRWRDARPGLSATAPRPGPGGPPLALPLSEALGLACPNVDMPSPHMWSFILAMERHADSFQY